MVNKVWTVFWGGEDCILYRNSPSLGTGDGIEGIIKMAVNINKGPDLFGPDPSSFTVDYVNESLSFSYQTPPCGV